MASIQGLQKAIDEKAFDPVTLSREQLLAVDELLKTGELTGYNSIGDLIQERKLAAVSIAKEKEKKLSPFQAATKEAGFEITRPDLEAVGDITGGAFSWIQDKDKLVNAMKKGLGAVEMGMDTQALAYRVGQLDKFEKLLTNMPVVRNVKMFQRTAGAVGKVADGFRQLYKAGPNQFLQTEAKSIAMGVAGAGVGSLAFDAANYATDFTYASTKDIADISDSDVAKLPPIEREAYHALEAMNNSAVFNAGAAALGPLLGLASGSVKKILGLNSAETEQLARYSAETGIKTNIFGLIDPNKGIIPSGTKNILNVVGIFPATAGPGIKYKSEIEQQTFRSMLDHLEAGAPYSHAELLSLGSLNQMKQNYKNYMDTIGVKYDVVFKEADLVGPELKLIPMDNTKAAVENMINSLKAQYPSMNLGFDKALKDITEFDDPLVKLVAAIKNYSGAFNEGVTAKEFVGLNKMLTAAYNQTKIYDPRALVGSVRNAFEADFNTIAQAPSIQVLLKNPSVKETYDELVKSQGKAGADSYVENLIKGTQNVQKELVAANDFFSRVIRRYEKSPVAKKIRTTDSTLFTNMGLMGVSGNYSVQPDELWSKTLKQVFRSGSKDSIEEMKFILGYNKEGPGKEIFDRFKQLYLFDAFQHSFDVAPFLKGEPTFELMEKARSRGVIMKNYVDDITNTLTGELDIKKYIDPKALIKSGLGEQKFVDMKFQADKVAGFNPIKFEENLGLSGAGIGPAEYSAARDRLIAMYGGGQAGKEGFDTLNKMIQLMKTNSSYGISDTSTFIKRRAMLGGVAAIAGGVLPFASAASVGLIPTLAFVFMARYASSVLSNPKSLEALFDVLKPGAKIEKNIGSLGLSKKRAFADLLNRSMEEQKDAPKIKPDLSNAKEITDYLLRKPTRMPNAKFNISALIPEEKNRMYPEIRALQRSSPERLAGGENFVRGAAMQKQKDLAASLIEANIPDPSTIRQNKAMSANQLNYGVPVGTQQPMQQPSQPNTQVAQNPSLYRALNPQDTIGQAIVEQRRTS